MRGWLWRIEREPAAVEEGLEPGAKIHGSGIPGHADIPEITRAVAGGNIRAAAQRHGEMGKVPANADALDMSFERSAVAAGVVVTEFDVAMHVVADRLHALPAATDAAEPSPCEVGKFLRIAVPAPQQKHQCVIGQSSHIPLPRVRQDFVRQADVGDDEFVADLQKARRRNQPRADIAEGVAIIMRCDPVRKLNAMRGEEVFLARRMNTQHEHH